MKIQILLFFLIFQVLYAQDEKKPIKIETKLKNESSKKAIETFTPVDNSSKFKIDPKEISEMNALDTKSLHEKIDSIRDKVFDAKSRLIETTKDDIVTSAPLAVLTIDHTNKMSSRFSVLSLTYILDGKRIYSDYDLYRNKKDIYPVFNAFLAPGHHEIFVEMVCSGSEDSSFNYLKDYRIKVQSRFPFIMPNDKKTRIKASSFESGTIFTSFKDRPSVEFETITEDKITENVEK
ncbi:MAG: hypothetical protein WCQ47_00010 [bacterium]